jgi:hypothetical protein
VGCSVVKPSEVSDRTVYLFSFSHSKSTHRSIDCIQTPSSSHTRIADAIVYSTDQLALKSHIEHALLFRSFCLEVPHITLKNVFTAASPKARPLS